MAKKPQKTEKPEQIESDLSQEEAEQKRDIIIKRMLNTLPKKRGSPLFHVGCLRSSLPATR